MGKNQLFIRFDQNAHRKKPLPPSTHNRKTNKILFFVSLPYSAIVDIFWRCKVHCCVSAFFCFFNFSFLLVASTFCDVDKCGRWWSHSNCRVCLVDPTSRECRWMTNENLKKTKDDFVIMSLNLNKKNRTSQIGKFVQVSLLLADVPVQALSQRIEPVGDLVLGANGRHWINGCCNPQTGAKNKKH